MKLEPLFSVVADAVLRTLGQTRDGERRKAEFRGSTGPGSAIQGKVGGFCWILQPPLGSARIEIVQEIAIAAGERFTVQLEGSGTWVGPDRLGLKAVGVAHPADGSFAHLDGHIVVVEGQLGEGKFQLAAYHG